MSADRERAAEEPAPVPFDAARVPFGGVCLVEASAGTGKTYAITELVLRWVAEQGVPVESILVVTFTRAATAELRDRIRDRLAGALRAVRSGAAETDGLLAAAQAKGVPPDVLAARLSDAVQNMDRAAVQTIHAWCLRVLQDHAFESGALFESDVSSDRDALLEEAALDFWRRHVAPLGGAFYSYLEAHGAARLDAWTGLAATCLRLGPVRFLPDETPMPPGAWEADLRAAEAHWASESEAWRRAWDTGAVSLSAWMSGSGALNRRTYREGRIADAAAALDGWVEAGMLPFAEEAGNLVLFAEASMTAALRKGAALPDHSLPGACTRMAGAVGDIESACTRALCGLRRLWLEVAGRELARLGRAARVLFHDQLVGGVRDALAGPHGNTLAEILRRRYPVALIDEFQDTDAVQVDLFERIYGGSEGTALFLIGDPKQSIYAFRGADVFAYLRAARAASHRFTLHRNWRSEATLVKAVNRLFGRVERPFLLDGLPYHAVASAREGDAPRLAGDPEGDAPFHVLRVAQEGPKPMTKQAAVPFSAAVTATEIVRILAASRAGAIRWSRAPGAAPMPLEPGDMAVLVRTHRHGAQVRAALEARGVPSVVLDEQSVFDTPEARDLRILLAAAERPADEGRLRAAWMTELLGADAANVAERDALPDAADSRRALLVEAHALWSRHGWSRMFAWISARAGIVPRLAGLPGGERRLTNLRHLAELIEEAAAGHDLGMEGLLRWFDRQRSARAVAEEHLIRLESDERRVHITTIHRSKGLEYPVVFLPLAWEGQHDSRSRAEAATVFHDPARGGAATIDLGSADRSSHEAWAAAEARSEALRLFYVAVTRAAARVYLVLGRINSYGHSAAAWLLHGSARGADDAASFDPAQVAERVSGLGEGGIDAEVRAWAGDDGCVIVREARTSPERHRPDHPPDPSRIEARAVGRTLFEDRAVTSFSHLAAHAAPDLDRPETDAVEPAAQPGPEDRKAEGFHAFPGGTRTGIALHAVLEELDFKTAPSEVLRVCGRHLARHGFPARWTETVASALGRVLTAPMKGACGTVRLCDIPRDQRVDEMEFYMPIERTLTPAGLASVLARTGWEGAPRPLPESIGRLTFGPTRGYVKGFIDLVFEHDGRYYLADYKSNRLGPDRASYRADSLENAMVEAQYTLQYLIYTVALHRFLRLRLGGGYDPEQHLGGVFYLFLRGMADAEGEVTGVFHDHPSAAAVEALSEQFGPARVGLGRAGGA